jgi:hypothetical protein
MRMITRAAVVLGLGGALVLGSAGVSRAATAAPAAPAAAPASDGLGGVLSGLLGGDENDGHQHSHVKVRCDDGSTDDGTQVLAVHGLSVVAVLQGVHVLGLNLGNCDGGDHSDGLLGGLLGGDNHDDSDGLLGGLLGG